MFYKFLRDDKGLALPMAFLVMIVVMSLAGAMLTMSNMESKISSNDYEGQRAFYLADSGTAYAMSLIDKDPTVGTGIFKPQTLDLTGGTFTVDKIVYVAPAQWIVDSIGTYNKTKKKIQAKIFLNENNLDKLKEIQIGMPVGVNIDLGKKGTINDVVYYGVPNYISLYKDYSPTTPVFSEQDIETKLENDEDNVVYKYQGDLALGNIDIKYNNKKILYVDGDLEINSNTGITPQDAGDFFMIIVTGKISYKLSGNDNANIDCVVVADTITFDNNNAFLEGLLVANNIIISNSSVTNFFDYKASVVKGIDLSGFLNTKYRISNWKIMPIN